MPDPDKSRRWAGAGCLGIGCALGGILFLLELLGQTLTHSEAALWSVLIAFLPVGLYLFIPYVVDGKKVVAVIKKLISIARDLEVPIVLTEHYPQGLKPTVPEISDLLGDECKPLPKVYFSCLAEESTAADGAAGWRRCHPLGAVSGSQCSS